MILYSDSESEMYCMDPSASWMRFTNYCTGCTSTRLHAVNNGDIDLLLFQIEHVLTCIVDIPTPNPTLSPSKNSTINSSISVVSPKVIIIIRGLVWQFVNNATSTTQQKHKSFG